MSSGATRSNLNYGDFDYDPTRRTERSFLSSALPIATYAYDITDQLSSVTNELMNTTTV